MVPWNRIADFILGDYDEQVKAHRRLRSEYKSQIRRLERKNEVRAVETLDTSRITEDIQDTHLDADDKIKEIGNLSFGEYEFDNCGSEGKTEVISGMEQVVDACSQQIWKYKILSFSRGVLFLTSVVVVSIIGIGSLL